MATLRDVLKVAFRAPLAGYKELGILGGGRATCDYALTATERIARVFMGLVAKTMTLWEGGVYCLVQLLSPDVDHVRKAMSRAKRLYEKLLAYEDLVASGGLASAPPASPPIPPPCPLGCGSGFGGCAVAG